MLVRTRLLLLPGILLALVARGFDLQTDESDVYTVKWHRPNVALEIRMPNSTSLSDGRTAAASVRDAAETWNTQIEFFTFNSTLEPITPRVAGNGRNELVIESKIAGSDFGSGVLAVTLISHDGNEILETDIVFNAGENWDSYSGPRRSRPDIHRVALHELGHVLGLEHPDEAGQNAHALMNSRISDIDALQADDISGAQWLYGEPHARPFHDNFADAGMINPYPLNVTVQAFNVGAGREVGEPAHAGVPVGHSIWWTWTALANADVTLDTFGSDFDTVLAVYTGTSLADLTLVVANDDEETPEQNPTPSRRRTSKVSFTATDHVTYAIAVDGWGDPVRFPSGSTGRITLNLERKILEGPPHILVEPADSNRTAGATVRFTVDFGGEPAPTLQWQRRLAGTDTWENLPSGADWGTTTLTILDFRSNFTMAGDQFRCVATNAFGTATSRAATLFLTLGEQPAITFQPQSVTTSPGETVHLQADVSGAKQLQWLRNGIAIPDATSSRLTLLNVTPLDAGDYQLIATNDSGEVRSEIATVSINPAPLIAPLQASVRYLEPGSSAEFSVSSSGSGSLRYQWYRNGRPISGATADRVTQAASPAGLTVLSVQVTDDNGTTFSPPFFVRGGPRHSRPVVWGEEDNSEVAQAPDAVFADLSGNAAIIVTHDGRARYWGSIFAYRIEVDTLTDVVRARASDYGALALHADGSVTGIGEFSQVPPGLAKIADVTLMGRSAVALRTDGSLVMWNADGMVADLPFRNALSDAATIASGGGYLVVNRRDGTVAVWQSNPFYRVADVPLNLDQVTAVAAGGEHILALREDGTVVAWGANRFAGTNVPSGLNRVVAIAAGAYHSLALRDDGSVVAWGRNQFGQTTIPAGLGTVSALAAGGDSSLALVAAEPPSSSADSSTRLINLSIRSRAGQGDQTLVTGFVIEGTSLPNILVRGIGPALAAFGITGSLNDPLLRIFDSGATLADLNDNWAHYDPAVPAAFSAVGAFALPDGSRDSVVLSRFKPGAYSAHLVETQGTEGVALIEIYDASSLPGARLSNVSARTFSGSGNEVLVAGFVLAGEQRRTLLIRGIGPTLANFGLPAGSVLANPQIKVFSGPQVIAANDDWNGSAELASTFARLGAFALPDPASRDAALLVTLDPGAYTVQVSGADGGTGVALVEIYDVP